MTITLKIPDEVLDTIKLPKKQVERELRKELAFILYEREIASMGSARKLSELTKWEFIEGLTERGIRRHYDEKELEEDIERLKKTGFYIGDELIAKVLKKSKEK